MIGCTDYYRIYIFVGQELVIVMVASYTVVVLPCFLCIVFVDQRLACFHAMAVEVADSHNPRLVELPYPGKIVYP